MQLFNHLYNFILIDLKADVEDDGFQDRRTHLEEISKQVIVICFKVHYTYNEKGVRVCVCVPALN